VKEMISCSNYMDSVHYFISLSGQMCHQFSIHTLPNPSQSRTFATGSLYPPGHYDSLYYESMPPFAIRSLQ